METELVTHFFDVEVAVIKEAVGKPLFNIPANAGHDTGIGSEPEHKGIPADGIKRTSAGVAVARNLYEEAGRALADDAATDMLSPEEAPNE